MIRTAVILWGTVFHTAMIACALYVCVEGAHPYLKRRLGPAPLASIPTLHPAREYFNDVHTALRAPD